MDWVFRTISKAVPFVKGKNVTIGNVVEIKKNIDTCVNMRVYLIPEQRRSTHKGSREVLLETEQNRYSRKTLLDT